MARVDPKKVENALFRFNAVQSVAWCLLVTPTVVLWKHSILWIGFMSVWANFATAVAGFGTAWVARQERKREDDDG